MPRSFLVGGVYVQPERYRQQHCYFSLHFVFISLVLALPKIYRPMLLLHQGLLQLFLHQSSLLLQVLHLLQLVRFRVIAEESTDLGSSWKLQHLPVRHRVHPISTFCAPFSSYRIVQNLRHYLRYRSLIRDQYRRFDVLLLHNHTHFVDSSCQYHLHLCLL